MATSRSSIAKSGWLYRQSSVLKKWRRYYFSLTVDGMLRYFETEFGTKAEDAMLIPAECIGMKLGTNVLKVKPPEGLSEKFLMSIEAASGKHWVCCGESEDEIKAWQLALEEARHIMHQARPSSAPPRGVVGVGYPQQNYVFWDDYSGRYRNMVFTSPGQPVVYTNYPGYNYPGYPVIIYDRRDRYLYNNYCGPVGGAATGLLAGAAIGSLLWTPFLFAHPFMWC